MIRDNGRHAKRGDVKQAPSARMPEWAEGIARNTPEDSMHNNSHTETNKSRANASHRATDEPSRVSPSRPSGSVSTFARKRNWRGRFVKNLRMTPDGSREWLIWSHYHNAWHCRSPEGGACGYTSDIAKAGLFVRETANSYNDGDRNEAFHASEKLPLIEAALRQHNEAIERLNWAAHIAQEALSHRRPI